jgi:ferredoxin/flavodoxin---NADP+ reductase
VSDRLLHAPKLAPSAALTVETVRSVNHWNEHLFSFSITRPASFRFRSGEFVMRSQQWNWALR